MGESAKNTGWKDICVFLGGIMGENKLIPCFIPTDKITEIRPNQLEALDLIWEILENKGTKIIGSCPTGSGKTLLIDIIFNYFNSIGKNCLYCSPLNQLTDQVELSGFKDVCTLKGRGAKDTKTGRPAYPCIAGKADAGIGYCRSGKCPDNFNVRVCKVKPYSHCNKCVCWKCIYKMAFQKYKESKKGNTNFTLFMMGVTNSYDVLAIDEADDVESTVRNHFSVTIPILINKTDFIDHLEPLQEYIEYLNGEIEKLDPNTSDEAFRKREELVKLSGKIIMMLEDVTENSEPWVVTVKPLNQKTMYQPITIDRFLEPLLANKIVIMMSATPPSYAGYAKIEVDSVFPIETRQWSYVPLGGMSKDSRNATIPKLAIWLSKLKGKTIVHTVSEATAAKIAEPLRMLGIYPLQQVKGNGESNEHTVTRYDAIKAFIDSKDQNKIYLSYNMGRGVDLFQPEILNNVVAVIPFKNPTEPLIKARRRLLGQKEAQKVEDEEVARDIAQMMGRTFREGKFGSYNGIPTPKRGYIVASEWGWWYKSRKKLFPKYFRESELKVVK